MSLLKWDWIHFTEGGAKLAVLTAAEPYKYCFEIKLMKFEKMCGILTTRSFGRQGISSLELFGRGVPLGWSS